MSQKEVEIIITRQFATFLAMPIFIVDTGGNLIFYNEPSERILGLRFDETGEMPAAEWARIFVPRQENGSPLLPNDLPLIIALRERRPAHARFHIRGWDNVARHISVTAFPLMGQCDRFLGAVAILWEEPE